MRVPGRCESAGVLNVVSPTGGGRPSWASVRWFRGKTLHRNPEEQQARVKSGSKPAAYRTGPGTRRLKEKGFKHKGTFF